MHSTNARKKVQLHRSTENFVSYQRSMHYASIKILSNSATAIAELVKDNKHFIMALKRFLIGESLFTIN